MSQIWEKVDREQLEKLSVLPTESKDTIILSSFFNPKEKLLPIPPFNYEVSDNSINLLAECSRLLKFGGLLFVYGLPHHLAHLGQHLSFLQNERYQMLFKYWIALDIDDPLRNETLKPTHQGLIMFLKSKPNAVAQIPFHLNVDTVRLPHAFCSACKQNVKDWGGKKHLMNPNGTTLSDVWKDFPRIKIRDNITPNFVLDRIYALTKKDGAAFLHIVQSVASIRISPSLFPSLHESTSGEFNDWNKLTSLEKDKVYQGDCITFLNKVATLHPERTFDLVFADPPYNLNKSYEEYEDGLAEQHYIDWCNRWLEGMAKTLKPGGSLIVLNLPKWAIHHAAFLNKHLEFRHWIAWDALPDPRGKIMPAHYALLYYTKPGAKPTFNYAPIGAKMSDELVQPPDSPQYCLRASCISKRKRFSDDKKSELSDIWLDVHRIKHKRDRDAHPCQLPEKLMERIILLTTRPGGLVFDPFCGTGTTAIAANKLGRHFVTIDLDPNYVQITNRKLEVMRQNVDLFGNLIVPRQSVKKSKAPASKKEIETYLQQLAQRLGREPSEQDIERDNVDMLRKIDLTYPTRLAAIKRCRVALKGAIAS